MATSGADEVGIKADIAAKYISTRNSLQVQFVCGMTFSSRVYMLVHRSKYHSSETELKTFGKLLLKIKKKLREQRKWLLL